MDIDLLIIGSGFRYKSEAEEIRALRHGKHTTTTADMRAVKTRANVTRGVASVKDFIATLLEFYQAPKNNLRSLSIMGHSDNVAIDFEGELDPDLQGAASTGEGLDAVILRRLIQPRLERLKSETGRDLFLPQATITLYGCHTGQSRTRSQQLYAPGDLLLQATADTFGRRVFGFSKPLRDCVVLSFPKRDKILARGFFRIAGPATKQVVKGQQLSCPGFTDQLENLIPDVARDPS